MRSKLGNQSQHEKEAQDSIEAISYDDRTVWFIWIVLVFIAIAALPFIARSPDLVGFIADLCVSITPF
ncbi:MAG: hypothetical protein GWP24_09520 [Alphaproteobacteria bacterium]|nr:hypothetical protein [Alphaproteobacteria bacterium]